MTGTGRAPAPGRLLRPELPRRPAERRYWENLYGSARALAVAEAAADADRPVILLAADPAAAARFSEHIRFYLGGPDAPPLLSFPAWETLPYDVYSPYQDIVSERLAALARLPALERGVLVVPVSTAMHRLLPGSFLQARSLVLETGQVLEPAAFRERLVGCGYRFVSQVTEPGDAAVRGSLIDVFPMGAGAPYRIDLLDDTVDSIRTFDAETQRSSGRVERVDILPAREIDLSDAGIARFRAGWRSRFSGNPGRSPIYTDVSNGFAPAGIEYYLPLFYETTQHLLEYLEHGAVVVFDEGAGAAVDDFWSDVEERYQQGRHDSERPLLPPREVFYPPEEFFAHVNRCPRVELSGLPGDGKAGTVSFPVAAPTRLPVDARAADPFAVFRKFLSGFEGRVLLVAESAGRRETLLELLARQDLKPEPVESWLQFVDGGQRLALTVAPLEEGALILDPGIAVIGESQLFGDRAAQRRLRARRRQDAEAIVRDLTELAPGAPVVHEAHGVGRYRGLVTLTVDGMPGEYLCLEYDQGDKLYVPVGSLDLISRYTGVDPEHAPLHRLGSDQWEKARRRAAQRVFDVAAELLELNARRAARSGTVFRIDDDAYRAFVQGFPFEETPGQMEAIEHVLHDMNEDRPMDRLICGDSGFGKTEVAMRAALIAALNGRQVAILVPTTLLAQQHYQTFKDRFADWPVRVEVLSRFVSRPDQDRIIGDVAAGHVDITIGTHRLLQKDIRFARLGLVVIDEEHRFGVRQKERFKALRAEVDVLTLTATPIPRTLNMALSGLRDISIISTAPSRRLAVKTFVREWNEVLVREALLREIKRGGQVYFLHNEVKTIADKAEEVRRLVPDARVRVAHGQMPERELEQVMLDFYHRRFNILVCTTIIETGIDVPSANTIIINRADKFGLAQLYQLRGRVGRSHHRAYAYLVIPPRPQLTPDAVKRLEAVESLEELGIGFTLATHDLEIRGAGEILGEDQSGQLQEIGFGLYMDLLERAVRSLKQGQQPDVSTVMDHNAEIDLHVPALIPEDYLPDVHSRLILYKRIASTRSDDELRAVREEIIDRFGLIPDYLGNLLQITRLKQRATAIGIRKIDLGRHGGRVHFHENANVDPGRLVQLVQGRPADYRFDGRDKLRITMELEDATARFKVLDSLFDDIAIRDAA